MSNKWTSSDSYIEWESDDGRLRLWKNSKTGEVTFELPLSCDDAVTVDVSSDNLVELANVCAEVAGL